MLQAVYSLISSKIKPYASEPGTYALPCSELSSLPAEIGFQLESQNGEAFTLTVPNNELSLGAFRDDPEMCQTVINATPESWIIGASLLKHYYSVWDIGGKRMGFAPNGEWSFLTWVENYMNDRRLGCVGI